MKKNIIFVNWHFKSLQMYRLILLYVCLSFAGSMYGEVNTLSIETVKGVKHIFILDQKPVSWYENKKFCTSVDGKKILIPSEEVKSITFYDDPQISGVAIPLAGKHEFVVDGRLLIMPEYVGGISVYDMDGNMMNVSVVRLNGGSQADLSILQSGIYIVKTDSYTFKLYLR